MRLYSKLKPLAPNQPAGKSNKGLFVVAYATTGSPAVNFTVNAYNSNGSTFSLSYTLLVTSSATGIANSTNNMLIPFRVESWQDSSGSYLVYELY